MQMYALSFRDGRPPDDKSQRVGKYVSCQIVTMCTEGRRNSEDSNMISGIFQISGLISTKKGWSGAYRSGGSVEDVVRNLGRDVVSLSRYTVASLCLKSCQYLEICLYLPYTLSDQLLGCLSTPRDVAET